MTRTGCKLILLALTVAFVIPPPSPAVAQVVVDMPAPPRPTAPETPAADIDPGALAMARYAHGRQRPRPDTPAWYGPWYGYQPRSAGLGPWGLGNHWAWYGNIWTVSPFVFHASKPGFCP